MKGDEEIPVDKVADSAAEAAAPLESESTQDSTALAADIAVAHSDEFMQRHDEEQDSRSSEVTSHGMILAHDYPRDDYHNLP